MLNHIRYGILALCAATLVGCGPGSTSLPPAGNGIALHGNGTVIVGQVVRVEEDGSLLTNIPVRWLAADRTDQNPIPSSIDGLPEGQKLEVKIGGRKFPALWACVGLNAVEEGEWCAKWSGDGDYWEFDHRMLVLICKDRSAAKEAGASVGTEVRLVKVGEKF